MLSYLVSTCYIAPKRRIDSVQKFKSAFWLVTFQPCKTTLEFLFSHNTSIIFDLESISFVIYNIKMCEGVLCGAGAFTSACVFMWRPEKNLRYHFLGTVCVASEAQGLSCLYLTMVLQVYRTIY